MICVSLAEKTPAACLAALEHLAFAEIRLDRMIVDAPGARDLFSRHRNLIATCAPGAFPDGRRKALLLAAIEGGAAYVDVELGAACDFRDDVIARAREAGCAVIISFHDYEATPSRSDLERTVRACFDRGADIAKIACAVRTKAESARLLGLLDDTRRIVVIGMGPAGRITRVVAPLLGSPFTFASLAEGKETADGQIDHITLAGLLGTLSEQRIGGNA
jgi:3-dehydroquinate dehydratase type I